MRYPASENIEIIRLIEQSHLPVRLALAQIGIPRATFYRWYDLYQAGGPGSPPSVLIRPPPSGLRSPVSPMAFTSPPCR